MNENGRLFNQAEEELAGRKRAQEALREMNLELDARVQQRTNELSFANEQLLESNRKLEEAQIRVKENLQILSSLTNDLSFANEQLLQSNQKLEESLHEKEALLKEVHHRVKNNLQILSSLLNLQANQVKEPKALQALRDSQARVRSMALIHEKLYKSKNMAKIDFGEYVQSLANDLFRSYQRELGAIQLRIQVDEVFLDLDQAVPCGLILSELITNAFKHAFPNSKNGTVTVELRAGSDHTISLSVADDGVGFPAGLDIFNNKSLGLQLVNSLVAQVDGKLEVENSAGTVFRVSFMV